MYIYIYIYTHLNINIYIYIYIYIYMVKGSGFEITCIQKVGLEEVTAAAPRTPPTWPSRVGWPVASAWYSITI